MRSGYELFKIAEQLKTAVEEVEASQTLQDSDKDREISELKRRVSALEDEKAKAAEKPAEEPKKDESGGNINKESSVSDVDLDDSFSLGEPDRTDSGPGGMVKSAGNPLRDYLVEKYGN